MQKLAVSRQHENLGRDPVQDQEVAKSDFPQVVQVHHWVCARGQLQVSLKHFLGQLCHLLARKFAGTLRSRWRQLALIKRVDFGQLRILYLSDMHEIEVAVSNVKGVRLFRIAVPILFSLTMIAQLRAPLIFLDL